eukprot:m51a1_g5616 putative lim zinc finger domain containing protein (167) ;mRNA; f:753914-754552
MVFCHQCGANNPSGNFCNQCGAKLQAPPTSITDAPPLRAVPSSAPETGPMCYGCGKMVVPSDSYAISALGGNWHKDCFKCSKCGEKLFSFSKFFEDNGRPVCNKCNHKQVPFCASCHEKVDGEYVMTNNKPFHKACFKCAKCGQQFGEDGFYEDRGKLWHLTCALP